MSPHLGAEEDFGVERAHAEQLYGDDKDDRHLRHDGAHHDVENAVLTAAAAVPLREPHEVHHAHQGGAGAREAQPRAAAHALPKLGEAVEVGARDVVERLRHLRCTQGGVNALSGARHVVERLRHHEHVP